MNKCPFTKSLSQKPFKSAQFPNLFFSILEAVEIEQKAHFYPVFPLILLKFQIPTNSVKRLNIVSCQQQQPAEF